MSARVPRSLGRLSLALVCLAGLMAGSACDEPFPPETQVDRLRLLGVRAEPPEVGLFDSSTLDALAVDPEGQGRPLRYDWAVCLAEIDSEAKDIDCPGQDAYPLAGHGPATVLSMPELVAWLAEQGLDLDLPEGEDLGVDSVPLIIGVRVTAGQESVRALKRVKVRLAGDQAFNNNPQIAGLEIDGAPVTGGVPALRVEEKHELNPLVTPDSQDIFLPADEDEERPEDLLFSWFSSGGSFRDQRTILDVDHSGEPLQVNEWKLPDEPGTHRLWLLVRDGRYGIDWQEYSFEISE